MDTKKEDNAMIEYHNKITALYSRLSVGDEDREAAEVVKLIFRLFMEGKNRNQIAVYLKEKETLTPTFYMKQQDRGTAKNKKLNE